MLDIELLGCTTALVNPMRKELVLVGCTTALVNPREPWSLFSLYPSPERGERSLWRGNYLQIILGWSVENLWATEYEG